MSEHQTRRNVIFAVCLFLLVGVFLCDYKTELGVAAGVPYIAAVATAFIARNKRAVLGTACIATVLVVIGYAVSSQGGVTWKAITNRGLAIFAIWTVAVLCLYASRLIELLRAEQTELRVIFEASPVGKVMVNVHGTILTVNKAIEDLFGYRRDELLGQSIETIVPEIFPSEPQGNRLRFNEDSPSRPMRGDVSVLGQHKSGLEIPVDVGLSPVETNGELRVLSTIIDLREQQAGKALRAQAAQLSRANQDLEQFAYVASHDLKSPLRAIDNLAKWIVEDVADRLPETSRKHLDQLQGRARRMETLLDDLLNYSRAGRTEYEIEFVECSFLLHEILETLCIPEGFRVEVEAGLPSLTVRKAALRQVLMNLISNAIKHHDRSDGCVQVRANEYDSNIEFIIQDDGPGIAAEFHERAFKPFQTLQSRDQTDGTGLGLAIVRRLVENEGGTIQLSSQEGEGACFRVTWPKQVQTQVETTVSASGIGN